MLKNIVINKRIIKGLSADKRGFPSRYKLFGGDTETVKGEPMSIQLWDGKGEVFFSWVNYKNVTKIFCDYIKDNLSLGRPNIYYFHNLQFDLGILLFPFYKYFELKHIVDFEYQDMKFEAVYSSNSFCKIFYKGTTIYLLDSMAFMAGGSLEKWGKVLSLPVVKMERPENIGDIDYRKLPDGNKKKKYFVEYAKTDVITQWHLGDWILKQHKQYDVGVSVSSAHFSSRVFKKTYLPSRAGTSSKIPFPPKDCVQGALLSYHGGRNGYYWDKPAIFENCTECDITSSYPFAMVSIPNMVDCSYQETKIFDDNFEGIYLIEGVYHKCKYPAFFTHDLKELEDGTMFRLWVTSYEIREALKDNSLILAEFKIVRGFLIIPANYKVVNPFQDFVSTFFNKKEMKGIDDSERTMYKIILNSLYGKFIQTTLDEDNSIGLEGIENRTMSFKRNPDGSFEAVHKPTNKQIFLAGGLFQPVIATLITGFARAYLHRLEHKYQSIHSSTDSVKFNAKRLPQNKIDAYRRKLAKNKDKGVLGDYGVEVIGKCIILRNKLYLHYNEAGEIEKNAFHGFAGRRKELLEVINTKNCDYTIKRMLKIREASKQGLKPFIMTQMKKQLDVDLKKLEIVNSEEY